MRLLIDAHLDLALNAINYDRDLRLSLAGMNAAEREMDDGPFRGRGTVTYSEMRRAGIAVCIVTLLARSGPRHTRQKRYLRADLDHATREGAYCACHAQLAYYRLMEGRGELRFITTAPQLENHWRAWQESPDDNRGSLPIGIVLSMEGADPILSPHDLEAWWKLGLRAIGPAHYGHSHYAAGTAVEGRLTPDGVQLLAEMQRLGMALDVTHLADDAMSEALDRFEGHVWASHHNCRSLVPWQRQLTDEQIQRLVARDAVIGIAFDAIMLYPGWVRGQTSPEVLDISSAADHIDHICQLAGDVRHVGIGTDLDGAYGTEQTPRDLKSIADVHKLEDILAGRGYSAADIDAVFFSNWLSKLRLALPHEATDNRPRTTDN
jgi:membrane dipeptidase